jgi:hypothetical protein
MASEVEICNRALQKLGAKRITSLNQDSVNARACNVAYEPVRDKLLRSHNWNFSISRAELAADSSAPSWGRANSFPLPSDYVRLAPKYPEDITNNLDWVIEGKSILTDDSAPIQIRYISQVTDPNQMDPLFREALSALLAFEICEEVTQSSSKKEALRQDLKETMGEAKKANAFEVVPALPPEDTYITCRM